MFRRLICCCVGLFFLLQPQWLQAYSSVTVEVGDPVYRQLDKLAAHGLIVTMIHGQRPFTRSEIARLIAEAMERYPEFEKRFRQGEGLDLSSSGQRLRAKVYVDGLLASLQRDYRDELIQRKALAGQTPLVQGRPLDRIHLDYLYLDQNPKAILVNNGLGSIQADRQSLVENREGRHYQSGGNLALETLHWLRVTKYLSFQAEPRFQLQMAQGSLQDENKAYVQRLNGHFTFGKLDLEIGRDSVVWGPSWYGGLAISNNARPLDMIKLSSGSPFAYPFFFKKLGQNQMSFVAANLGPEQNFKNPWMIAYKISNRKNAYFEFGMSQTLIIGGEGAPAVGFGEGFVDFFDASSNNEISNRGVAIELNGRVPQLRGLQLYAELHFADFTSNLGTLFADDTSYLLGVYLPRLNDSGTLDLRLEYRRLAPRYSRSTLFIDGVTENRRLLGDPLGPDSWALLAELNYELNPKNLLSMSFRYARLKDDLYQQTGSEVTRLTQLGAQNNYLAKLYWQREFNPYLAARLGGGIDQAGGETHWLGELGVTIRLGRHLAVGSR